MSGQRRVFYKCFSRAILKNIKAINSGKLKSLLPNSNFENKERHDLFSSLEFVARSLCGIAPLIELNDCNQDLQELIDLEGVCSGFNFLLDKNSSDYLNFSKGNQPLVDASFLALAFLRSPKVLWGNMPDKVKKLLIYEIKRTKLIRPHFNNWLLFSALIEVFLFKIGENYDPMRIDYALRQHEQWYLGDGHYGDGPQFRADYYNSFVILPFLLEITQAVKGQFRDWDVIGEKVLVRAQRYAEVQERMIGPDGTFPPIGRSIAYRGAAFHLLALLAWKKLLPPSLSPAQVRCALWAVIEKTLVNPNNYDENGWLTVGLNGHQPALGEEYISTGSLYLTSVIFLPLGLPEDDEFWSAPDEPWTQRKIWWLGSDMPPDKAL